MNNTRNSRIRSDRARSRIAWVAGIAAATVILAVFYLVSRAERALIETSRLVDHTHRVIETLDSVLIASQVAETRQRGYIITSLPTFLGDRENARQGIRVATKRLHALTRDNADQLRTAEALLKLAETKIAVTDSAIVIHDEEGFPAAAAAIRAGHGKAVMDTIRAIVDSMKIRELDLLRTRTDAEQRSLRATTRVSLIGGALAAILAIITVVLFQKVLAALDASRRSAEYAETLLNATSEGIYGLDNRGHVMFANRAMARTLGYAREEMIGKRAHKLFHHTKPDGTPYPAKDCPMYAIISSGGEGTFDNEIIWRKDGGSIPVEYSVNQMSDSSGERGAVVSFRDITDRQIAEAAMRKSKENAEAANLAKSDFLARMSHELRTPLNSVIGFSNVLLRNKSGNLQAQDISYLERIRKNGINLLALINDILDLSKIEAGRMEVELVPVAIDELVREMAQHFETQVAEKQIGLRLNLPEKIAVTETDPGKLQQVLINLVANAIKFTEKGSVTISVATDPVSEVPIAISVTDSGIGIPQNRIEAIFDAFEQADKSTARRFGGIGLGLPICRSLCGLMGYTLNARSVEGEGSTFTVDMRPAAAGMTEFLPSPDEEARGADAVLRGKLVLIIDDDPDARTLIAHQVASLGGRSAGAATGQDGIRLAREMSPDLITLDLMMPGMDGWQVMQTLQEQDDLKGIPVVVVSLVAEEKTHGLVGPLSILPKPLDRDSLARTLKKGMGIGRVLVVEDDPDSQQLLASFLYEEGAAEVRVVAGAEDGIRALRTFQPNLVLLDLVLPQGGGNAFLEKLSDLDSPPPEVIVVTSKQLSAQEFKALQCVTLSVLEKGENLETNLKQRLREFAAHRNGARSPKVPS